MLIMRLRYMARFLNDDTIKKLKLDDEGYFISGFFLYGLSLETASRAKNVRLNPLTSGFST